MEEKGNFDGAGSQYRKSLCMRQSILGRDTDHPGIASSRHQLGVILQKKEDFSGAESQYRASFCK